MEEIDQEHKLICFRITGDSCTSLKNGIVAKDLRALNRSLKDTVIIDSDPQSYLIQPDNAIPILPYRGGNDRELMDLERYLIREILCSGDVREINRHRFKLCNYWQYEDEVDLVKDLYLRENEY
jgi:TFIIF-interacting CTD phosphatase-like protein